MRLYTEAEAPRGTARQALVGWTGALAVGVLTLWLLLPRAWGVLSDWAQVMWP